jgi:hypothetical protein
MKRSAQALSNTETNRFSVAARVKRFLKLKRSLGFKMETEGILLNQFSRFASHRKLAGPLKAHDLIAWAEPQTPQKTVRFRPATLPHPRSCRHRASPRAGRIPQADRALGSRHSARQERTPGHLRRTQEPVRADRPSARWEGHRVQRRRHPLL